MSITQRAASIYQSAAWSQLREQIVRERGARCERCGATGGRIYADHKHEIRDGGASLDPANVELLCTSCHATETADARARRLGLR